MGRRKKKKMQEDEELLLPPLGIGEETRKWILALVSFAGMLFFVLAALGKAGLAGEALFGLFSSIFGVGYYLFPVMLLALAGTVFRSEKNTLLFTLFGIGLFFVSGLCIIQILLGSGGVAGALLAGPLISLFVIYASLVLLGTLLLISVLLATNITPSFAWLRSLVGGGEEGDMPVEDGTDKEASAEEGTESPTGKEYDESPGTLKKVFGIASEAIAQRTAGAIMPDPFAHLPAYYKNPPLDLLQGDRGKPGVGDIKAHANIIKRTLQNFGINVEMDEVSVGPSVTRYALKPAQGVKLARIVGLKNDLSLALAAH